MERIGALHKVRWALFLTSWDLTYRHLLGSRESWGTNRVKDGACMGWVISDALAMLQLVAKALLSTASGTDLYNYTVSVNLWGFLRRCSTNQVLRSR